jgi:hypothetical protein
MCIWHKTEKRSMNLPFIPLFKPYAHNLSILRQCTNIHLFTGYGDNKLAIVRIASK